MLSFTNKYNHNTRKHIYDKDGKVLNLESELLEFYHPENNVHNKYEFLDDDSLCKAWKLSIKGRDIKRKVQKNASPGFEFVISASEDWNNCVDDGRTCGGCEFEMKYKIMKKIKKIEFFTLF